MPSTLPGGITPTLGAPSSDCVLSLPYSVAAAISDRTFGVRQLTSMRISDGAVHELASRVKVHVDKKMDRLYPNEWPVLVDITLKDGRHAAKRLDKVIGCPARPMTDAELSDKFLGNAGPVLGTDRAEEVLEACMNLERAEDIGELVRKLAPKKGGALSSGDSFL